MAEHRVVIDGLVLPAQLSGHPALDFCNTLVGWNDVRDEDYLHSYEHLVVWAGFAGLVPAARVSGLVEEAHRDAAGAEAWLQRAREVRGRLYEVLMGRADARAFDAFADDFQSAAGMLGLSGCPDHTVGWEIRPEAGLAAPLHAVVWSAARLLTSSDRAPVQACPGVHCGWLFINRSGRRRWCTMATCGNRAKVRRFAARHRGDQLG